MTCLKPIYLKSQNLWVPCNNCINCRITKSDEWSVRIQHEMIGKEACFITLTYGGENAPEQLDKREFQLFWKRLRRKVDKRIKYFGCGEYGEENGRPHYHAIIIGWRPPFDDISSNHSSRILESCWSFGFNYVGAAEPISIRYVTGYIRKKIYSNRYYKSIGVTPPFQIMSKSLGSNWIEENYKNVIRKGVKVGGKPATVP